MTLENKTIGFALTGSFCTFDKVFVQMQRLADLGANVIPIFSLATQSINCRFGSGGEFAERASRITGRSPLMTLEAAEPIGPKGFLDILLIAPCSGNTLAKLSNAITDTPVLMAAKAHLRNQKPLVIALSTNDAMSMNFKNIGLLYNTKQLYFVPFGQDDCQKKPNSLVADMERIPETLECALDGRQIQPVLVVPRSHPIA